MNENSIKLSTASLAKTSQFSGRDFIKLRPSYQLPSFFRFHFYEPVSPGIIE